MSTTIARPFALVICIWLLLLAAPRLASGQIVILGVSPLTITFVSADPDTMPTIAAPPVTVSYWVLFNGTDNWQISLRAGGDLSSGPATIGISNVTWTATPAPPFQNGTLSSTVEQRLASGTGSPAGQSGTVIFHLANSWSYNVGTYSTSVVFTLTAP